MQLHRVNRNSQHGISKKLTAWHLSRVPVWVGLVGLLLQRGNPTNQTSTHVFIIINIIIIVVLILIAIFWGGGGQQVACETEP